MRRALITALAAGILFWSSGTAGTIWAEDRRGGGARIASTLPVA